MREYNLDGKYQNNVPLNNLFGQVSIKKWVSRSRWGAFHRPPQGPPAGHFGGFFYTILETHINEELMQIIGSLAFKFWMWWAPKDRYP